jgi:O-antigen/teichoic acid export membrane protein
MQLLSTFALVSDAHTLIIVAVNISYIASRHVRRTTASSVYDIIRKYRRDRQQKGMRIFAIASHGATFMGNGISRSLSTQADPRTSLPQHAACHFKS